MGFWDFLRRKKKNKDFDPYLRAELLEPKKAERKALYGGLCEIVAGRIAVAIAQTMLCAVIWALEGSPGYSYAHDWEGKRRLSRFKWHFQRRRAWQRHNRNGRVSLKQLGWRVVNLET